jgi:geranylgeranyl diphosphate synthase type I
MSILPDIRKLYPLKINKAIFSHLHKELGTSKSILKDILYYHFDWPKGLQSGKRLRPMFLLICTELGGGKWEAAIPVAVAVEFLHNYSLIHDDIEDKGFTRHGRLSVWKKFGIPQAINTGDALYGIAFHTMAGVDNAFDQSIRNKAFKRFSETAIQLTIGQSLDLSYSSVKTFSTRQYWRMVKGKTAELFALACELGGLLAGMNVRSCEFLRKFGLHIGYAFQIKDDILGIWGNPAQTGKSIESDLLSHKNTLPIVYGLTKSPMFRQLWDAGITRKNIGKSIQILDSIHTLEYSERVVKQNSEKAIWNLGQIKGNEQIKTMLQNFVMELMNRSA